MSDKVRTYSKAEVFGIVLLSLYCAALVIGSLVYIRGKYCQLIAPTSNELGLLEYELVLFESVVAIGVLGSALRGVSSLFLDVGKRTFDGSWSLSYLMRPLEGAAMALVVYIVFRSGIFVLAKGESEPNGLGYLALAGLSGMFSHKAADGLRSRFDKLISG